MLNKHHLKEILTMSTTEFLYIKHIRLDYMVYELLSEVLLLKIMQHVLTNQI